MAADRPYVAVVGGGEAAPDALEAAEEVGRHLARRGAVVVCGGLGGVMEAVCRGAKAEGGNRWRRRNAAGGQSTVASTTASRVGKTTVHS